VRQYVSHLVSLAIAAECVLVSCTSAQPPSTESPTPAYTAIPSAIPTAACTPTSTPVQTQEPPGVLDDADMPRPPRGIFVATPGPTATPPAFTLVENWDHLPTGVYTLESPGQSDALLPRYEVWLPIEFQDGQIDLLVEEAGYDGYWAAHLDLHGHGTHRSWYAQMGYQGEGPSFGVYCQARSYSSPERFGQQLDMAVGLNEWHTFRIEVVPTEIGWQYAFRYSLDGREVCYYQPPDRWDGDNSYEMSWRKVEIWTREIVRADSPIRILIDNWYSY